MTEQFDPRLDFFLSDLVDEAAHARGLVETRIKYSNGAVAQYFAESLGEQKRVPLDTGAIERVFVGLNPRRVQRRTPSRQETNVAAVRLLSLDVDPVRPAGVPANDEEHELARIRTDEICDAMEERGYGKPYAILDSGNGFRPILRLPFRVTEGLQAFGRHLRAWAKALAREFDDDRVKIDTHAANVGSMVPLAGTVNRKGTPSTDRPHRVVQFVDLNQTATSGEALYAAIMAAEIPPPTGFRRGDELQRLPSDPWRMLDCPLVAFLVHKARTTRDLRHRERLSLGSIGNALGDAGRMWVHDVLAPVANYRPAATQKQLGTVNAVPYRCKTIARILRELNGAEAPKPCTCPPQACRRGPSNPAKLARTRR